MAKGGVEGLDAPALRAEVERALGAMDDVRRIKLHLTNAAGGIESARGVLEGMVERVRGHLAAIDALVRPPRAGRVGREARPGRRCAPLPPHGLFTPAKASARQRKDAVATASGGVEALDVDEDRVRDAGDLGQLRALRPPRPPGRSLRFANSPSVLRNGLHAPTVGLRVDDVERLGRGGHDGLVPRELAVELDHPRVRGRARSPPAPVDARIRAHRAARARACPSPARPLRRTARPPGRARQLLVPAPVHGPDDAADLSRG